MTFTIWNITMFKNEPFLSNRWFKKRLFFLKKVRFYFFIKLFFAHFLLSDHFFESLITHKRFIFEVSYILYGKRPKSCTLIVILVKCLYLTAPIFNSPSKSNRIFFVIEQVPCNECFELHQCNLLVSDKETMSEHSRTQPCQTFKGLWGLLVRAVQPADPIFWGERHISVGILS